MLSHLEYEPAHLMMIQDRVARWFGDPLVASSFTHQWYPRSPLYLHMKGRPGGKVKDYPGRRLTLSDLPVPRRKGALTDLVLWLLRLLLTLHMSPDAAASRQARPQAIEIVNEIVGEEFQSERLAEYRAVLGERREALEGQRHSVQLRMDLLQRDRCSRLQLLREGHQRVLERARTSLAQVEEMSAAVAATVSGTLRLARQQDALTACLGRLERFRALVANLERLEAALLAADWEPMAACLLATQQLAAHCGEPCLEHRQLGQPPKLPSEAPPSDGSPMGEDGAGPRSCRTRLPTRAPSQATELAFPGGANGGSVLPAKCSCPRIVAEQLSRLGHLEGMMRRQIMELFQTSLSRRRGAAPLVPEEAIRLAHAATVLDVLGPEGRDALVHWYCEYQLEDYRQVFRANRELCTLAACPQRYAWLKRLLIGYEAEHALIFPPAWQMDLALCREFCAYTTADLGLCLEGEIGGGHSGSRSGGGAKSAGSHTPDLVLLQAVVQQTRQFEHFLQRKFGTGRSSRSVSGLLLSPVFEPYLGLFVAAHDRDVQSYLACLPSGKRLLGGLDDDSLVVVTSRILASAPELFLLFKEILLDIADLSRGRPLADLSAVLARHLTAYAKYLESVIPSAAKAATGGGGGSGHSTSGSSSIPLGPVRLLCILINTADYCLVTGEAMEGRLREETLDGERPANFALVTVHGPGDGAIVNGQVSDNERDPSNCSPPLPVDHHSRDFETSKQELLVALSLASARLQSLFLGRVEETAWTVLRDRSHWAALGAPGDQSVYIGGVARVLGELSAVRLLLVEPKHYVTLCHRLAQAIIRRFGEIVLATVRPLSEAVCQQLLIDLEALRVLLLSPAGTGHKYQRESLARLVAEEGVVLERTLKCLLLPPEPVPAFVQSYLMITGEGDLGRFEQVLTLREIKKGAAREAYLREFHRLLPERPAASEGRTGRRTATGKAGGREFAKLNAQLKRILSTFTVAPTTKE